MIRQAKLSDLVDLVELAHGSVKAYNPPYDVSLSYFINVWSNLLLSNHGAIMIAEENNKPIGAIGVVFMPDIFSGKLTGYEVFWYMDKKYTKSMYGVKLLKAMESLCVERGCKMIIMSAFNNDKFDKLDGFYNRFGYKLLSRQYFKEV